MSYLTQKTIKNNVNFSGIALHSGHNVNVCIKPANANFGIVFKRVDLEKNNEVYPNFLNVTNTSLNTTIENQFGAKVSTIEHLMGALFGLGIDNAYVDVSAPEVPIMDGSAAPFVFLIQSAGIEEQDSAKKFIRIKRPVSVKDGDKVASFSPFEGFKVSFSLDFDHPVFHDHSLDVSLDFANTSFVKEVSRARTFGFMHEVEYLRSRGLARGGSVDNAIVVDNNRVLNKGGLRNELEFVNHKILDCMGDLYLAGYKIIGHLVCSQGGHSLTNKLLRKVFENKANFSIFELKEKTLPHTFINKPELKSIA